MNKRDILFFLGGAVIGATLTAVGMKLYEKHQLEAIDATEWEMPVDDRDPENTEEVLGADLSALYPNEVHLDTTKLSATEREELVRKLNRYKSKAIEDLGMTLYEREELVRKLNKNKSQAIEDLGKVEIEEKAPLEHSDDDGASFDFDKEAEAKIAPKDAVYEIDYEEVSDHGNNFTADFTFFADGVLMNNDDETVAEINTLLPISLKNKDLYAIFEKNGYEEYCLRDSTTDTDYVISWSDESYKELYGE